MEKTYLGEIQMNDKMIKIFKDDIEMNKTIENMAYKLLITKECNNVHYGLSDGIINKNTMIKIIKDCPEKCYSLLFNSPGYFNSDQKLILFEGITKDRNIFIRYLKSPDSGSKTLALQSKIAEKVSNDAELSLAFAEFLIHNWKIKDIREHVKKLKISNDCRQQLIDNFLLLKLLKD